MSTSDFTSKVIEIPLTRGFVALVDECDSDLAAFKWQCDSQGYARREVVFSGKRNIIRMHIVIMERILNRVLLIGEQVDHIYGIRTDNRRSELRLATPLQNAQNARIRKDNTSGYKGVFWDKHV